MARPDIPSAPSTTSYQGEVWTDERGYATVSVPSEAAKPQAPLEYALDAVCGNGRARIAAELSDGLFTIRDRRAAREGGLADHRSSHEPSPRATEG